MQALETQSRHLLWAVDVLEAIGSATGSAAGFEADTTALAIVLRMLKL